MEDEEKAAVRRIFGRPADAATDEPVEDPPPSGHVPGEGSNPQPRGEMTLREFADALFNPPPPL